MIAGIESILEADDAAREGIEAAGAEAKRVRIRARGHAQEFVFEALIIIRAISASMDAGIRDGSRHIPHPASVPPQAELDFSFVRFNF